MPDTKDQEHKEDEVLRRMLKTPPMPFTPKKKTADKSKPSRPGRAKKASKQKS